MKIRLENVGVINRCDIEFIPGINLIIGSSGSGKSTLMRCIHNTAVNNFADSDVSFGKNSMSVSIECNGSNVTYVRNLKSRGEKCSYTVNGEQYVKLGKTPLQAVTDTLKIGDIDINGDKINFNFNLQFSAPFLILGSQSTLYNVLTYRNTFDISSINDYYSTDVKSVNSAILSNKKLCDNLQTQLDEFVETADKLSSVEQIYSTYMQCKHINSRIDDLHMINKCKLELSHLYDKHELINTFANSSNDCVTLFETANECNRIVVLSNTLDSLKTKLDSIDSVLSCVDSSIRELQQLSDVTSLLNSMTNLHDIMKVCCDVNGTHDNEYSDNFINDVVRIYDHMCILSRYNKVHNILETIECSLVNAIDSLLVLHSYMSQQINYSNQLCNVNNNLSDISIQLNEFKICPLCGCAVIGDQCNE